MSHDGRRGHDNEAEARGVIEFRSEQELQAHLPCKVYRLDQSIGNIWDHTHDYIQIWYVLKGEFKHTINHHSYHMVKGNLFIIPPFAVHRVEMVAGQEVEIIGCEFLPHFVLDPAERDGERGVDFSYLEQFLMDEKQSTPKVALTGDTDIQVGRLLQEMLEEYQHTRRYYELVLKADLLRLLAIIIREYTKPADKTSEEDDRVEKYRDVITSVTEYIHLHYAEELRLERLCREFSLSKTYFCYLFKRFTGKTFNDYLIDLRVRKAVDCLLESDMSITEICFGVGFNDLAYFSRIFKRHTGLSPSQYKKKAPGRLE
ncbi:AraC family transcriptional regulator [Paenibacillus dendritiformis]|uniref:AraC family transcriptional regulator n=1 Tax=Paenibacillus dendritiformis TaxID=130049 RepID=UPI00248B1C50|nr:AraC family transcriptional regulator [Paenibacillus dendritiformis]WGU94331.1 AraC family transcriptional regulator [Paenibacillus dendritiformis]